MPRYDDDDLDGQTSEGSKLRQKLEQEIEKRKQAEAERDTAQRHLNFAKAGIDLADPRAKYFIAGYDGEMEPEKIKAAATEHGFVGAPEPTKTETPPQQQDTGTPPQGQSQQLTPEQVQQMEIDQRLFGGIQFATQQQDTSGINHRAGMEKAVREGGAEGLAAYMRSHGLPVAGDDQ